MEETEYKTYFRYWGKADLNYSGATRDEGLNEEILVYFIAYEESICPQGTSKIKTVF